MKEGKRLLDGIDMLSYSKLYLKELLETLGCEVTLKEETFNDYSMEVYAPKNKTTSTIAINPDCDVENSGQVIIELSRLINGREIPTGLLATKAEYFVFKIFGIPGAFCIPSDKLLDLYQNKRYKSIRSHFGDPNTKVAVFDRELLLDNCEQINAV